MLNCPIAVPCHIADITYRHLPVAVDNIISLNDVTNVVSTEDFDLFPYHHQASSFYHGTFDATQILEFGNFVPCT